MFNEIMIHDLQVSGEIIGYAHDFCNRKLKENQKLILVFPRNLFSFDFFFSKRNKALCLENKIS